MARSRIGLALGGGAARGWSHIGIIDALVRAGIEPDIICGTSIGALVGAAYVTGRLSQLRQWAEAATWREVVGLVDVRLLGGGLVSGVAIVNWLRELGVVGPIEECPKQYAAVATNLATGREVWLQSGSLEEAVRASIALPGIFSPVRVGDEWLVDGGLSNPVPVSVCRALGADLVIAVHVNSDLLGRGLENEVTPATPTVSITREFLARALDQLPATLREQVAQVAPQLLVRGASSPGYFEVLANSINIMQDHITRTRLAGDPPHVMLMPNLRDITLLEFNRAKEAIDEGYRCVEDTLPILRRHIAPGSS